MLKKLISDMFYFCSVIITGPCFNTSIIRNRGIDAPLKVSKWLQCLLHISKDWDDTINAPLLATQRYSNADVKPNIHVELTGRILNLPIHSILTFFFL